MQKFSKGVTNLGYFKKREGAAASSIWGSTGRQCLKISLVFLRGPLNTPLENVNSFWKLN